MIPAALLVTAAAAAHTPDTPMAGGQHTSLDGLWEASLGDLRISAAVPGDLVTDLFKAGVIPEPLLDNNFKNSTPWGSSGWVYRKTFHSARAGWHGDGELLLVFDSVKMGARVELNGHLLGETHDQFVRYEFPLASTGALRRGVNVLTVTFDDRIDTGGRFMACSGGWDWAPYTTTYSAPGDEGDHTFSKGLVRSVYLLRVDSAAIAHVVPHVFYNDEHPTSRLRDGAHAGFTVRVRVHLIVPSKTSGVVSVAGSWGAEAHIRFHALAGASEVTLELRASADEVKLWWPVGAGEQHLYRVVARFTPRSGAEVRSSRRIGFRHAALVTSGQGDGRTDGTGDLGMLLRINGAAIFARGANMIPMDEQEGRYDDTAHRVVVKSAAEGGMNTLRVWGGGVFLPDAWYEACDEVGVMVWHDMMFTTTSRTHEPQGTAEEELEIRHAVRRLSNHPSIIMWNTCNECSGGGEGGGTVDPIYIDFVMTTVVSEDSSRAVWPASPSAGWDSGVDTASGHPNGNKLQARDPVKFFEKFGRRINEHGWYQNGNGFEAVNQFPAHTLSLFDPQTPPDFGSFVGTPVGPQYNNSFNSEFGASVMSSFESVSPTLTPEHWGLHGGQAQDECVDSSVNDFWKVCTPKDGAGPLRGNPMAQRNYPCDNTIATYFGEGADVSRTGEDAFRRQLWRCMISQALFMKAEIEKKRARNVFGQLTWQLNEIWPTGGWGSLEYGTPSVLGQATGGRWKPLHHWLKASLFADAVAACGVGGQCFVRNDAPVPFEGKVWVGQLTLAGTRTEFYSRDVQLPAGAGALEWFSLPHFDAIDGSESVLVIDLTARADGATVSRHVVLLKPPKDLSIRPASVTAAASSSPNADGSVDVTVSAEVAAALFVTLTTLADGRFSDNVFELAAGEARTVRFYPFDGAVDVRKLSSTLRVAHLAS